MSATREDYEAAGWTFTAQLPEAYGDGWYRANRRLVGGLMVNEDAPTPERLLEILGNDPRNLRP